ncbi:hypothetical protein LY632_09010 [Erythrobacter sp. SDW2]|uniref:hypothetical protein n=1 Tax=Erythrobacter sp. SDW2 TaxID=2907154 RepID=UPI001F221360|nr:hypothetical protein [Erythrobacter sp. SDW2]UIP05846.1 hypothetical protein LY632_09010 [Erythrobacter sp. SDW2]
MGMIAPETPVQSHADEMLALALLLEEKLTILDRMGAHIAAAHLDAAIARIRADATPI